VVEPVPELSFFWSRSHPVLILSSSPFLACQQTVLQETLKKNIISDPRDFTSKILPVATLPINLGLGLPSEYTGPVPILDLYPGGFVIPPWFGFPRVKQFPKIFCSQQ